MGQGIALNSSPYGWIERTGPFWPPPIDCLKHCMD